MVPMMVWLKAVNWVKQMVMARAVEKVAKLVVTMSGRMADWMETNSGRGMALMSVVRMGVN